MFVGGPETDSATQDTDQGALKWPTPPKTPPPGPPETNQKAAAQYAMEDREDFDLVERGFIAGFTGPLKGEDGHVIFDPAFPIVTP